MNPLHCRLILVVALCKGLLALVGADATASDPSGVSWRDRPTLFGGPGSPEAWLAERGVGLDISWTQFGQAMLAPSSGDNSMQWGGKLNAKAGLDFSKLGLWEGFSGKVHYEYKTGDSVNDFNGVLLPVNTQMYEPKNEKAALSWTFTQRFGKDVSLTAGKFNMVDAASATPIVGGGGINTFWNLNFAAPPSGLVPAYITGLSLGVNTEPVNISLMVYDPKDSQNNSGLDGWGQDGINTRLALRFPAKFGGHDGYYSLIGVWSTKDSIDLADLPWIVLPVQPPSTVIDVKGNSWYFGGNFQQYLWQSESNPAVGWGLFGQAYISDGNPNNYRWFVNFGVGGTSPIAGRAADRYGIGVFNTAFSKDLTNSLTTITGFTFGDERGIEMFYNAAVCPWLRVATNLQFIRPGVRDFDNAVFAGLSAQVKF